MFNQSHPMIGLNFQLFYCFEENVQTKKAPYSYLCQMSKTRADSLWSDALFKNESDCVESNQTSFKAL